MKRFLAVLALALLAVAPASANCPSLTWSPIQTINGYVHWVESVRAIDYDHDGKLDLVGKIRSQADASSILHTWRGVGDGTFESAVSLGTTMVDDIEIANVNNDAYLDIVATTYSNSFFVRLGNATGFDAPINTFTNFSGYDVSITNLNNDNYPDLLMTSGTSNIFVLYAGVGNGTFTEIRRETVSAVQYDVWYGVAGDFDNDTYVDVAVQKRASKEVAVYFRNANGTFQSPVLLTASDEPRDIKAGDFNEDGLLDLASTNWYDGVVDVYLNQGSRAFAPRLLLNGKKPGSGGGLDPLEVLDVDGDGNLDLLVGGVNQSNLVTFLGQGNGTFAGATWSAVADGPAAMAFANFDSDPELEIAMGSFTHLQTANYSCATTQLHLYTVNRTISSGQTSRIRAVVSAMHAGIPEPRGTVTFKEGVTTLGTVNVDANGNAALDHVGFSLGDHTITAEFSGNSVLAAATSTSVTQSVISQTSSITITVGTSTHGEAFNSTVNIKNRNGSSTFGWYYLTVDGVTETKQRYSSTPATLTLSGGPHTISAEYVGDFFDPPSNSQVYNFTTAKHVVNVSKSGDTTKRLGSAHAIQITVSATTTPTPTGSVELFRGTTSLGTVALSNGVASFNITHPRGSHDLTAVYSGDTNYLTGSLAFRIDVLPNTPLAIDARALDSSMAIAAVIPDGTSNTTMFRRVHGTGETWTTVASWSQASPTDTSTLTRGVLYDYRLDAVVSGVTQQSNIDASLLFTDPTVTTGSTKVKLAHFTELRDSINALRAAAGLSDFAFDGTFGASAIIRAAHLSAMRTAANEARTILGMPTATFTDNSPAGVMIKRAHITELRDATH